MVLLGDLGGLFGSLMLIGAGIHFMLVGNTIQMRLMKHYFLNNSQDERGRDKKIKSR